VESSEIAAEFTGIIPANVEPVKMFRSSQLGNAVAENLLKNGANRILEEAKAQNSNPSENPQQCPFPNARDLTKSMLT